MKLNKSIIGLSLIASLVSLFLSLITYICLKKHSCYDFIFNMFMGIFSGSFLTLLTSIISYKHEKITALESFYLQTKMLISFLNKYDYSSSIAEKAKFFSLYSDIDKTNWHNSYRNIHFFINKDKNRITKKLLFFIKKDNHTYIYEKIYEPLKDFNNKVYSNSYHFNIFIKATNGNEEDIRNYIKELEYVLLEINTQKINSTNCTTTKPKLTRQIREELGGKYYDIMYSKRKKDKLMKKMIAHTPNKADEKFKEN